MHNYKTFSADFTSWTNFAWHILTGPQFMPRTVFLNKFGNSESETNFFHHHVAGHNTQNIQKTKTKIKLKQLNLINE